MGLKGIGNVVLEKESREYVLGRMHTGKLAHMMREAQRANRMIAVDVALHFLTSDAPHLGYRHGGEA